MVVTKEVNLPTFEELTVDECNVSSTTLMAAAPYIGKHCEGINTEFMLCRQETRDARACIDLGKRVTSCTLELFKNIKNQCLPEFEQYAYCVDKSSGDYGYRHCRNTQQIFDQCMADKLKIQRPGFGYFCRARVHTTSVPAPPPPPCPCQPKVPDATPSLPDDKERPPARFGSRYFWVLE